MKVDDYDGVDHLQQKMLMDLPKHELKVCYWTEGVPSVKTTTGGGCFAQTTAVAQAAAAAVVVER